MRGYFGIGIYNPKKEVNIGTLWRSAMNFGAAFIFTIGKRYRKQAADTTSSFKHIPLFEFINFDDFNKHRPRDCQLIGIEQSEESVLVGEFKHPERAIYLLGAEDNGLSKTILTACQKVVEIDTPMCLNVAVAGSIIMFDRKSRLKING